jgi:hypothetical protein
MSKKSVKISYASTIATNRLGHKLYTYDTTESPIDLIQTHLGRDLSTIHGGNRNIIKELTILTVYKDYDNPFNCQYFGVESIGEIESLQQDLKPLGKFKSLITYNYANIRNDNKKISIVEIMDFKQGIIKINADSQQFLAKFSPTIMETLSPKICFGPEINIDEYGGIVTINSKYCQINKDGLYGLIAYSPGDIEVQPNTNRYPVKEMWFHSTRPLEDFGYIVDVSQPRIVNLLSTGFCILKNLQQGDLTIRTSAYDPNGYQCKLHPELILEIIKYADSLKGKSESSGPVKQIIHISSAGNAELVKHKIDGLTSEARNLSEKVLQLIKEVAQLSSMLRLTEEHKNERSYDAPPPPFPLEEEHKNERSYKSPFPLPKGVTLTGDTEEVNLEFLNLGTEDTLVSILGCVQEDSMNIHLGGE